MIKCFLTIKSCDIFSPNKLHQKPSTMAPVVVFVLVLLAPAFSLPFAIPEYIPEIQIEEGAPVINSVPQIQPGVNVQEKTGAPVSTGCSAGYSVPVNQQNVQPVTRVQNAPVNVEQPPESHTETPLFLPPQPVPVVPVSQAEQIVRPVIVPAEAIASGRVIIMSVDPIQQRAFPDVVIVPQQQTETAVQQIQAVEKQTPYQESYSSVQPNNNAEQYNAQENLQQNEVPQRQGQVQAERTHVYPEQQGIEKQVHQVVQGQQGQVQYVEKQATVHAPLTQTVEPVGQNVQSAVQKQLQPQGNVEPVPQQQVYTVQSGTTQKQAECGNVQTQYDPQQRVNVQDEQVQQSVVEAHQQQIYSVQPQQVDQQTQSAEPQHEPQQHVNHPVTKAENQQAYDVPQQVSTYTSGQVYNFGDRIPQQHHVQSAAPQQQQYLVQPVVVENQS